MKPEEKVFELDHNVNLFRRSKHYKEDLRVKFSRKQLVLNRKSSREIYRATMVEPNLISMKSNEKQTKKIYVFC